MSRQAYPGEPGEDEPEGGHIAATGPGPLVVLGVLGLFLGWAVRGSSLRLRETEPVPTVSWVAVGATWFVAAGVAGIAYLTWRAVQRERHRLETHQAVARLVLGRTIARIGAFVAGGFLGASISNLGVGGESAEQALIRAFLAALGAGLATAAGLLLEQACRVPPRAD